jgi:hypothetical protein
MGRGSCPPFSQKIMLWYDFWLVHDPPYVDRDFAEGTGSRDV